MVDFTTIPTPERRRHTLLTELHDTILTAPDDDLDMGQDGAPLCGTPGCVAGFAGDLWKLRDPDAGTDYRELALHLGLSYDVVMLMTLGCVSPKDIRDLNLTKDEVLANILHVRDHGRALWPERARDTVHKYADGQHDLSLVDFYPGKIDDSLNPWQLAAVAIYGGGDYDRIRSRREAMSDTHGDTLFTFIMRELSDAGESKSEAVRMMRQAALELEWVADAIEKTTPEAQT